MNSPFAENLQKVLPVHSRVQNLYKNRSGFKDYEIPVLGQDSAIDQPGNSSYNFIGAVKDPSHTSNSNQNKDPSTGNPKSFRDVLCLNNLQDNDQ